MHLNALTRKSTMMALIVLVVMVVAAVFRRATAPFAIELANGEMGEVWRAIVAAILFIGCGAIEGRMLSRTGLTSGYSALPIPIYALLSCGIFLASNMLVSAVVSACFVVAIFLLLRSINSAGEKDSLFFAATLLGAMVPIYPPSILLAAVVPLSMLLLVLSVRQAVLMIVGYVLPLFAAAYVTWYGGAEFGAIFQDIITNLTTPKMGAITEIPYVALAMVAVVVCVLIWGAIYLTFNPGKLSRVTRARRSLHFFVWTSIIVVSMLFIPSCDLTIFSLLAVPVSILLGFMLGVLPNNPSTISYWILLALFVVHLFLA